MFRSVGSYHVLAASLEIDHVRSHWVAMISAAAVNDEPHGQAGQLRDHRRRSRLALGNLAGGLQTSLLQLRSKGSTTGVILAYRLCFRRVGVSKLHGSFTLRRACAARTR